MPKGLLELSIEQELIRSEINSAQRQKAQETVDALAKVMSEHRQAAAHIRADGRLTEAGQASDLAVLAAGTDTRLASIGDERLESLDKRIGELEYLTREQAPPGDPTLRFMKEEETRRYIQAEYGDELELMAAYQSWSVTGENDQAMRAVESAPLPMLSDQTVIEQGKAARGSRQNAESAKTLRQLRSVRSTIAATINGYRAELNLPDLTIENLAQGTAA